VKVEAGTAASAHFRIADSAAGKHSTAEHLRLATSLISPFIVEYASPKRFTTPEIGGAVSVRCLVSFYGLNRSLRWTAASIRKKILKPLREADTNLRCVAHFNEPATIHSDHSAEFNLPVTRRGLASLPLDAILFENQHQDRLPRSVVDTIEGLPAGPRLEPRATMINLLSQLYSLRQVWRLAALTQDKYDVYIFLRPDLEYLDRIEPATLFGQILSDGADLITPSWHQWGGLNDRFAFCSSRGAEAYALRLDQVERFCAEHGHLNAEELLASVANWAGLKLRYTNIRAMRIRADGATLRESFELPPPVFVRGIVRKRIHRLRTLVNG
jgi:hypothetical protein